MSDVNRWSPLGTSDAGAGMVRLKRSLREVLIGLALYVAAVLSLVWVLANVSGSLLNAFLDVLSSPVPDSDSGWLTLSWFVIQVFACWLVQRLTRVGIAKFAAAKTRVKLVTAGSVTVALFLAAPYLRSFASYVWSFASYEGTLQRMGGFSPLDCGRVFLDASPAERTEVDSCVANAFKRRTPFVARYDQHGIDSDVADSYVLSPHDELFVVSYDSDPSGGGRTGAGVWDAKACHQPPGIVNEGGQARLQCE